MYIINAHNKRLDQLSSVWYFESMAVTGNRFFCYNDKPEQRRSQEDSQPFDKELLLMLFV